MANEDLPQLPSLQLEDILKAVDGIPANEEPTQDTPPSPTVIYCPILRRKNKISGIKTNDSGRIDFTPTGVVCKHHQKNVYYPNFAQSEGICNCEKKLSNLCAYSRMISGGRIMTYDLTVKTCPILQGQNNDGEIHIISSLADTEVSRKVVGVVCEYHQEGESGCTSLCRLVREISQGMLNEACQYRELPNPAEFYQMREERKKELRRLKR